MKKFKKTNKKILAILFVLITIFSTIQPIFAITIDTSGSAKWVAGQWDSRVFTTDNKTSVGLLMRRLVNYVTGERVTTFCAEHGVNSPTGEIHTGTHSVPMTEPLKYAYKIAFFGWYSKYGDYVMDGDIMSASNVQKKLNYCFTQQYIWEKLGQSSATFVDSDIQSQYISFKSEIDQKINNMEKTPSFTNRTIELNAGTTTTLTDSNGVLRDYNSFDRTVNGIRIVHNHGENTMQVIVNENCNVESYIFTPAEMESWNIIKEETRNQDTTVYITFNSGVQNQLIAMNYNDPVTMSLSLKINAFGKLELQKLDTTGTLVNGAIYNVSGNGYNQDFEVRDGKIVIEKLKKGIYSVKEKNAPTGYLLDTKTYNVEIRANQTSTQAIVNTEPTGTIKITKTDVITGNQNRVDGTSHHGDATLKDAVYTLYANEDIYNKSRTIKFFSKDEEIATYTFNEYGNAVINVTNANTVAVLKVENDYLKGLPLGKYIAKETTVPNGYKLDEKVYEFNLVYKDQNTAVIKQDGNVTEDVKRAKFEVIKISSNDNTTADTIANAEFTAILSKYIQYYGSFDEALKHINEYADDEYDIFRTGANGHGVSKLLAFGEYEVRETYTPSDEIETVEPFFININQNSNGVIKEFVENDLPFESYLKMVKKDKNTGKIVTLSNATFKLYRLNEETNEWEKVKCKTGIFSHDSWKTDKTGYAFTENKLKAGTYRLEEIKIPNGFLELDEELTFKINKSNKTLEFDEDYDAFITVEIKNEQPTGKLELNKTIVLNENIDTSLVDISDLSKIEFRLQAKEKIIDYADGSTIYEKGAKVKTFNLDKQGNYILDNLPMGKYELIETKTLDGLVLDSDPIEVVFEKKDNTTKVYTERINVENKPTVFEFSKTDITGDKELVGAKLTVLDEKNNIIDSWVSNENTHKIEGLQIGKTYILREEITPDGYTKATDISFTVENTAEVQKVVMIDKIVTMTKEDIAGAEIEGAKIQVVDENDKIVDEWISVKEKHNIKNLEEGKTYTLHEEITPDGYVKATDIKFTVTTEKETQFIKMIDKIVEVSKIDLTNGNELEGAELEVIDKETGETVDKWTSKKENHRVNGLEENKTYILKETIAPYGYLITEEIEFVVSESKETQKVEMKDMPILKNVKVVKVDEDTKEVIKDKFAFTIYEDNECTKLIKQIKVDKDIGYALFEELRYGTYYIKETKAPKDYELSDRVVKIEINDKGIFVGDKQAEENENTIEFNFENKKIETPKTR